MNVLDIANITEINGTQYFGCGELGGTSSAREFRLSDYYMCGVYQGVDRTKTWSGHKEHEFLHYGNATEVNGTEIFHCGGEGTTSPQKNSTLQDYYVCGVTQGIFYTKTKTSSGHKQSVSNAAMLVVFVLLAQCFYAVGF